MKQYSLSELCTEIQEVVENDLLERYWVRAEIASLSARGHCYMELVEKATDNMLAAKVRATCWSNVYSLLSAYFIQETGQALRVGMQVLVEASVAFHPVYGLSLNIWNIDPTYTQGDLAKQRQATICRLTEDGVMDLQKSLEVPTLVRKVAVISAADAAGYGDFCDQLTNNRFGYQFEMSLFAATMQGDYAPKSIISALSKIANEEEKWDVVVIIRGGGATTDLGCFDDYELASHCAQFPIPILSGIGHTRDMSIVDMVVHTTVKTPTAAAEWLIERVGEQVETISMLSIRLQRAIQHAVVQESNKLQGYLQRMNYSAQRLVMREQNRLQMWAKTIELHSPERIFKMGYSLTMINGKPVMKMEDVKDGDVLKTWVQDGVIESVVRR
ncbi:MAG: exodeoxyribonuclease VII large subunit [Paludibacteraceae bacterium]|nr:exodeoxyribonuclease VII large subunit [Paludibacteraceae bacterium]